MAGTENAGYLGWAWNKAKNYATNYAKNSYSVAYAYGKIRGIVQPMISTKLNIHEIEPGVYIGDIASASNVKELKALGITHIITAVLGVSPQYPKDFEYLIIPVMDVESESIKPYLQNATYFIDTALYRGGKVLVHCMCGVSRSATVVAAWLLSRKRYTVENTIQMIKDKRVCIDPNQGFRSQLEAYALEYGYIPQITDTPAIQEEKEGRRRLLASAGSVTEDGSFSPGKRTTERSTEDLQM